MARVHVVRQGECLLTIAAHYGFADHRVLHDHPRNAELKRLRSDPAVLSPGDRVFIPDAEPASRLSVAPGVANRFRARVPTAELRARLEDEAGQPLANRRYRARWGSHSEDGTTDGGGMIARNIPLSVREVDVYVWLDPDAQPGPGDDVSGAHHVVFALGCLDPIGEASGVMGRLANLGYHDGAPGEAMDDRVRATVAAFQRAVGLEATGAVDDATRAKLLDLHGGR